MKRSIAAWLVVGLVWGGSAHAETWSPEALRPSSLFIQAGFGDSATRSWLAGASWDWTWAHSTRLGTLTGFHEISAGRWITSKAGAEGSAWATQAGFTPVLRLRPTWQDERWFVEAGVGVNVILPLYQTEDKRFSTKFNFGDHAAVGFRFGAAGASEFALRFQHFSNAGIDHPNPGENFFQIRYAHRL